MAAGILEQEIGSSGENYIFNLYRNTYKQLMQTVHCTICRRYFRTEGNKHHHNYVDGRKAKIY